MNRRNFTSSLCGFAASVLTFGIIKRDKWIVIDYHSRLDYNTIDIRVESDEPYDLMLPCFYANDIEIQKQVMDEACDTEEHQYRYMIRDRKRPNYIAMIGVSYPMTIIGCSKRTRLDSLDSSMVS